MSQASKYLSIDEVEVSGEEDVCAAALTWLHACPCDRQSEIFTVLSSVRVEYLDASYITHRLLDDQVYSCCSRRFLINLLVCMMNVCQNASFTADLPTQNDMQAAPAEEIRRSTTRVSLKTCQIDDTKLKTGGSSSLYVTTQQNRVARDLVLRLALTQPKLDVR